MARLNIPDEPTFQTYTVTTAQTVFPFTFAVFAKADLNINVDGVALDQSAFTFSGTVLENGGYQGGTVTLNASVNDCEVVVYRGVVPARASQFAPANTVPVGSVDQALNRLTANLQDARRDLDRALLVGYGETAPDLAELQQDMADTAAARDEAVAAAAILNGVLLDVRTLPEFYGAVAGPLSTTAARIANTTAINTALSSGYVIDGRGLTYDVHTTLVSVIRPGPAFVGFKNMKFRQRNTDVTIEKTFLIDGVSTDFVIENVTVDLMNLQQSAGMGQCSAFQISNCTGKVRLYRTGVINGGGITATKVISCTDVIVDGYDCRDFAPSYGSLPGDDVCQALEIQLCSNVTIRGSDIADMNATWPGKPSPGRGFSRGIVVGQTTDFKIIDNDVRNLEQCIDVSGVMNRSGLVALNRVTDAGTWAIKCANQFRNITICDNKIYRPGFSGITLSAPDSLVAAEQPMFVHIHGNQILNCGASGLYTAGSDALGPTGPTAITIYGRDIALPGYPAGVRIHDNDIVDDQTVKTMVRCIDAVQVNATGPNILFPVIGNVPRNREKLNRFSGFIAGETRGLSYDRGQFVGSVSAANQSIPTGVWTSVVFAVADIDDTAGMHDPASANTLFYPKASGAGLWQASVRFGANATGQRGVRFLASGGAAAYGQTQRNSDGAGVNTTISNAAQITGNGSTDYVEMQVFQDSGGALDIDLTTTTLTYQSLRA